MKLTTVITALRDNIVIKERIFVWTHLACGGTHVGTHVIFFSESHGRNSRSIEHSAWHVLVKSYNSFTCVYSIRVLLCVAHGMNVLS